MVVAFISLIIVTSILVVSCTNSLTTTNEAVSTARTTGNMTKQDFVFLNYLLRLDEKVVMENLNNLVVEDYSSRSSCNQPTIRNIVDNLYDIYDIELFFELLLSSGALYDCEGNIINPFDDDARNSYLALVGDRADSPICDFDLSLLGIYSRPQNSSFNRHEVDHIYALLHQINNNISSFQAVLSFIENTSNNPNFSPEYLAIVDSATNSLNFFVENIMGFPIAF